MILYHIFWEMSSIFFKHLFHRNLTWFFYSDIEEKSIAYLKFRLSTIDNFLFITPFKKDKIWSAQGAPGCSRRASGRGSLDYPRSRGMRLPGVTPFSDTFSFSRQKQKNVQKPRFFARRSVSDAGGYRNRGNPSKPILRPLKRKYGLCSMLTFSDFLKNSSGRNEPGALAAAYPRPWIPIC